jgi:hypothetical protein
VARDFNGSTDRIDYANVFDPNAASTALTISAWVYMDSITTDQYFVTFHNSADTQQVVIAWSRGASHSGRIGVSRTFTGGSLFESRDRYGTDNFDGSVWEHFLVESDSGQLSTGMECYIDDVVPGTTSSGSASGSAVAATGTLSIGARIFDNNRNFNGRMAEVGIWDRTLVADERGALAKGFSPLHFRRGLRSYIPLIGRKDIDRVGGQVPTYDGTVAIPHPRIIYPG